MLLNASLTRILDKVPCGIGLYEMGHTPRALYLNNAFFEIIGYTRVEFLTLSCRPDESFLHPEDRWVKEDSIQKLREHGLVKNCEYRVVRPDGTLRWVLLNLSKLEMDSASMVFASFIDITSTKETELALSNERMILQLAMQTAKISSWEYDVKTRSICQMAANQKQHGYDTMVENVPEALIANGFVHPDSIAECQRLFLPITPEDEVRKGDLCIRTPDRKGWRWGRFILTPIFDRNGQYIRSIGTTIDITEQKSIETNYNRQIKEFNSVNSTDLIGKGLYNLSKNIVDYFHGTESNAIRIDRIHTYDDGLMETAAQFVNQWESQLFLEQFDRYRMQQQLANGNTEAVCEYQRKTADGKIIWAQTTGKLYYEPASGDMMCFIYSYDINERKTIQRMIDTVVEMDFDYLALLDCRTRSYTVYANKENTSTPLPPLHGTDYEKEVAAYAHAYLLPEDAEQEIQEMSIANIQSRLAKQASFSSIVSVREEDGSFSRKKLEFTYLDRAYEKVLITRIDITDVYEREQEQLRMLQEANRAKTDFLSHMSHDLRTPMNTIIGLSELAQGELNDPGAMKTYVESIKSAGQFLLGLVNDCLDFEKLAAHKMQLHPVLYPYQEFKDGIMAMIGPLCKKKNIEFYFGEAAQYTVYIDKIRLEQIFFNLLSNAVKYTPQGGKVQFVPDSRLSPDGQTVSCDFYVRDNGIGMSEAFQKHLFEPFEQEAGDETSLRQGTGLGLSIVKELVSLMDGTIRITSRQGQGTEVMVHLDMPNVTAAESLQWADQCVCESRRLAGKTILLLEDQPMNMLIAQRLLEKQGMRVICAKDGRQGLETFMQSPEGSFDAILTDIRMPVMSGLETARAIRALPRKDAGSVPILAMTANAFDEDVRETMAAGMNAHLSKPVEPALLYRTLEECIFRANNS